MFGTRFWKPIFYQFKYRSIDQLCYPHATCICSHVLVQKHKCFDSTQNNEGNIKKERIPRPAGGARFLTDPTKVFLFNNWDNVSWDEEQESEAKAKVEKNSQKKVPDDMKDKYDKEADTFWDQFYSQHQNKFFKDRHWLFTEFPELAGKNSVSSSVPERTAPSTQSFTPIDSINNDESATSPEHNDSYVHTGAIHQESVDRISTQSETASTCSASAELFPGANAKMRILEVGCGVGNTVFPVLQTNNDPDLFVYGCDLSSTAVDILKEHHDYDTSRCHAFVCDVTDPNSSVPFPESSLDLVVLIFVLSAVHPEQMHQTIQRLSTFLKPGGLMVFRDYGRYDLAQLRFKDGQCLEENFYVRGDGTRVYFFTQEDLRDMFTKAGLVEEQNVVDRRLQVNRSRQLKMYRVWVQCKYRKPNTAS